MALASQRALHTSTRSLEITMVRAGSILARQPVMTISHSHQLLSLLVPCILVAGCTDEQAMAAARESESLIAATATIANMLPVDGCSYPVTIDGTAYAPDPRSRRIAADLVPAGETLTVEIDYRLTGGTATIACGFGQAQELPEISFRVRSVTDGM